MVSLQLINLKNDEDFVFAQIVVKYGMEIIKKNHGENLNRKFVFFSCWKLNNLFMLFCF